jgi:hypothetical protein
LPPKTSKRIVFPQDEVEQRHIVGEIPGRRLSARKRALLPGLAASAGDVRAATDCLLSAYCLDIQTSSERIAEYRKI